MVLGFWVVYLGLTYLRGEVIELSVKHEILEIFSRGNT